MATIHLNRSGTNLGTFSEEEVLEGLRSGRFLGTDLGWREGMAEWQALARFPEFAGGIPGVPAAGSPLVPPLAGVGATAMARTGLPWENRQTIGFLSAFFQTVRDVLLKPAEAFSVMRREGGLLEPLIYAVVAGTIGFVIAMLYQIAFQSLGLAMGRRNTVEMLDALGIGWVLLLILSPILVVVGLFIWVAIVHLCLMIVGGAKQPFETTFRVISYVHGSVAVFQLIPFCGGLAALIWNIVASSIGLARAHEIETGRAVVAILLPLILCCGLVIVAVVMAGGFAALQHAR